MIVPLAPRMIAPLTPCSNEKRIDGKKFAAILTNFIAHKVTQATEIPGLAVLLVGDDQASQIYVRNKIIQTQRVGMRSVAHHLAGTVSEQEVLHLIATLNNDEQIDAILVQLPLPAHIDEKRILTAISPDKDVDGFHPYNIGYLQATGQGIAPCTPLGSLMLLQAHTSVAGKNALIIGRSNIVGKPMSQLLLEQNATVTIAHSHTYSVADMCRQADVIIVAVGSPNFLQAEWIKTGVVILDVGINVLMIDGQRTLVGDVAYDTVFPEASFVSPVPGGVGPMTIACLLHNTMLLYYRRRHNHTLTHYCLDRRLLEPNWHHTL